MFSLRHIFALFFYLKIIQKIKLNFSVVVVTIGGYRTSHQAHKLDRQKTKFNL